MNEHTDRQPATTRQVTHWEDAHRESTIRLIDEIGRLRGELSKARTFAWAAEHGVYDGRWLPVAARPTEPGQLPQLPTWLATSVPPDQQDWWVPEPIYRTDLAEFTVSGHGRLRIPRRTSIQLGETILVSDAEEVLEAVVLSVEGDVAQIRVNWDSEVGDPDAPRGRVPD